LYWLWCDLDYGWPTPPTRLVFISYRVQTAIEIPVPKPLSLRQYPNVGLQSSRRMILHAYYYGLITMVYLYIALRKSGDSILISSPRSVIVIRNNVAVKGCMVTLYQPRFIIYSKRSSRTPLKVHFAIESDGLPLVVYPDGEWDT